MTKELTRDRLDDYLLDAFTELRPYLEVHHKELIQEMEQAYSQLEEMIQQKPTVTKEWVDSASKARFYGVANACSASEQVIIDRALKFIVPKLVETLGWEIVDD